MCKWFILLYLHLTTSIESACLDTDRLKCLTTLWTQFLQRSSFLINDKIHLVSRSLVLNLARWVVTAASSAPNSSLQLSDSRFHRRLPAERDFSLNETCASGYKKDLISQTDLSVVSVTFKTLRIATSCLSVAKANSRSAPNFDHRSCIKGLHWNCYRLLLDWVRNVCWVWIIYKAKHVNIGPRFKKYQTFPLIICIQ